MRGRLPFVFLVSLTAFAAASAAAAQSGLVDTDKIREAGLQTKTRGADLIPVEQALEELRVTRGWSFIFDSRLIAGKKIAAIAGSKAIERDLIAALAVADLQLHQIARNTYAVTSKTTPSPDPEINTLLDEPDLPIDTILVLGSSALAPTVTGAKRIFQLSSDDLAYLNVTTPAEAIYSLPQSLASFTPSNTALYVSAAGISLADLRGLGPKRTMVMVNGRRRTITTGGIGDIGGVDLGSISEPLLERIEVQNLPGGARFGAAAVAGTVNFVTKSDFSGLEGGLRLGISERGDSEEASFHVIAGEKFDNFGAVTVGLNVTRSEGLTGTDREFSATPFGFGLNGMVSSSPMAEFLPGFGGSTITDQGRVAGVVLSDGSFSAFPKGVTYVPAADGSIAPFQGALNQLYNWSQWQSVVMPNDRVIGQLSFKTGISDRLEFFVEAEGGVVATENVLAPLPASRFRGVDPVAGDAAVIPLTNPFLPQSIIDAAQSAFGPDASSVVFEHRFAEIGPRRQKIDRRNFNVATGVSRRSDDDRAFSLTYRYGRTHTTSREADRVDQKKLAIALDPVACAATPGCALADFFTAPGLSKSTLDFITIPEIARDLTIEEHEVDVNVSIPTPIGDEDGGRFSTGFELRRQTFSDRDHTPAGTAPIGYIGGSNTKASFQSLDAFAEFDSPKMNVDQIPGEIGASLAVRLAYSSNFDIAMNFEAGVDWRPAAGVAVFTRQHFGDRTPEIIELYSIDSTLETAFADPCAADAADQTEIVKANCASAGPLGVGAGFVQTSPLASSTFYGNPDLDPERVRSGAYGISLSPTELFEEIPGRMEFTATWLDFKISNLISDRSDTLLDCYSSPGFSAQNCLTNPRTGLPSFLRDPASRQIVYYDNILLNGGDLRWRGLDLEMRYAIQPERLAFADSIWVSILHTYTNDVVETRNGTSQQMAGMIDYPHHRTLASAGLEFGRWSFVAYANRRGKALTSRRMRPEAHVPAALYLDLTSRFEVTESAYVQIGVKNLMDRKPDITAFNDIGNFAPEFYDPIGRRYSLNFRMNF